MSVKLLSSANTLQYFQNFKNWVKSSSEEVDAITKPESKIESQKVFTILEDYIDIIPVREQEFQVIVDAVENLDKMAGSLVMHPINSTSQVGLACNINTPR